MLRFAFALFFISSAFSQDYPAFRWIQEIGGTGSETFAGLGTDSHGNTYIAGSTFAPNFPVKNAIQPRLSSIGFFQIDGPGAAYTPLGLSVARSFAIDPQNPSVIFAASVAAGYRTADGGANWTRVNQPSQQVQAFAIDPLNDQTIYAAAFDLGILKSTDGGASWTAMNNGIAKLGVSFGTDNIWADPNFEGVLFAHSQAGLYRSADGGASWTSLGAVNPTLIYFDPLYAGVVYGLYTPYLVWRSTDDGATFTLIRSAPGFFSILDDPNQPRLLGAALDGIYASTDDGASWTKVSSLNLSQLVAGNGVYYGVTAGPSITSPGAPQLVQISSDLSQVTVVGPASGPIFTTLVFANGHLYAGGNAGADVFVVKLDPAGNLVYSTYFGGGGYDGALTMAVDPAGDVFVTGTTVSTDFPVSSGAYSSTGQAFLFKLNPDGSLGYSTRFPQLAYSIAVDSAGSAYISGRTTGGLPTTPGAYRTTCCIQPHSIPVGPPILIEDAFVTKFDPAGSSLMYSTYLGFSASATDPVMAGAPDATAYVAGPAGIVHLNSTGTALLANVPPFVAALAIAVAPDGGVYLAGTPGTTQFSPTVGAFQSGLPVIPFLPGQGSGFASAIVKMDAQLSHVLASTYFSGPYGDTIFTMALDPASNVYVGGRTAPRGLPTRTPFVEAFGPSSGTGFVSELSPDLSTLLFSTYLGDKRQFSVGSSAIGTAGSVVVGGSSGDGNIFVNSIAPTAPAPLRIDSVVNAASFLGGPISPGETIAIRGSGFTADAQVTIGGNSVTPIAVTTASITAVVPDALALGDALVAVQSSGARSNQVLVPVAAASPGLLSVDGSGLGQGYILNHDLTLNSQSNPAHPGEEITIAASGAGPLTFVDGYAVTAAPANVFVDGFYADGVSATVQSLAGFPAPLYVLSIIVPDLSQHPGLGGFHYPPQVGVVLEIAGQRSQNGLYIWIAQ